MSRVLAIRSSLFILFASPHVYLFVYFSEWIFYVPEFYPKDHGLKHHRRGSSEGVLDTAE